MSLARTNLGAFASAANPGTPAFVTPSFTPDANSLLITGVAGMGNGGPFTLNAPTISGGGLSFTQVTSRVFLSPSFSIQLTCYYAQVGSSPSSMALTVDDPLNNTMAGWLVSAIDFTGYDTSGLVAGDTSSNTTDVADGAETQTLGATPGTDDVTLCYGMCDCSTSTASPSVGSFGSVVHDFGVSGGNGTMWVASRTNSTSTSVPITDVYNAGGSFFKAGLISFIVKGTPAAPPSVYAPDYSLFPKLVP